MVKKSKKNNKKKYLYLIIIFVLIVVGITGIYAISNNIDKDKNHNNDIEKGENFIFFDLDGNEKQLNQYRGKIVILDMWATWCQPCQYQMLELEKAYSYYSNNDLEILSINIDSREKHVHR